MKCSGEHEAICVIPDGEYADDDFFDDVKAVVDRLDKEGPPRRTVPAHATPSFTHPTEPDWGTEFTEDVTRLYGSIVRGNPQITLIGVSDDSFVQDAVTVPPHFESYRSTEKIRAVSTGDAGGTVGTKPHRERLYRMMLRAILHEHYGVPFDDDPSTIMWSGATRASDLDGKTIPAIPK